MPGDQPTATERARRLLRRHDLGLDGQLSLSALLTHPDLLADLAIEAGGLEQATKIRQRHERGRIQVMQTSEMWMDGEWLYRRTWKGESDARAACICPRFSDTGGVRIADLACPVHGVGGSDPGDGYWVDEEEESDEG